MGRIGGIVFLMVLLAVVAAGLYLAYGHFPAPTTHVERVLPDARFAK
jgi:hypothetical protein